MADPAYACHACGKIGGKLLRCGRCRTVWFCNRECQVTARQQGHTGANCRATEGAKTLISRSGAALSEPSTPKNVAELFRSYTDLRVEADDARMASTRLGQLAAVEKYKEAAAMTDLIGGAFGAGLRADAEQGLSHNLLRLGDNAAAARVACSSLRSARESGSRTLLVSGLSVCGDAANKAPSEMVSAEREIREQERLGSSPSYGGLDLSQEGRIRLPTTRAALHKLEFSYHEAAVALCDAALAAAGGRGSPAADDDRLVPKLQVEARARGHLAHCLCRTGEEQRSLGLLRQAVGLWRQVVRTAGPGHDTLNAQRMLADQLCTLGGALAEGGVDRLSERMVEGEACLREALALGEGLRDVFLSGKTLAFLINLCGEAHATVQPAEVEALRSRLNRLLVQMGRSPETSCSICLEPLTPPADGAAADAAGGGGAGGLSNSCVRVLWCHHQFHRGCLSVWRRTAPTRACPLCRS